MLYLSRVFMWRWLPAYLELISIGKLPNVSSASVRDSFTTAEPHVLAQPASECCSSGHTASFADVDDSRPLDPTVSQLLFANGRIYTFEMTTCALCYEFGIIGILPWIQDQIDTSLVGDLFTTRLLESGHGDEATKAIGRAFADIGKVYIVQHSPPFV